jgi:hypothetical protein
MEQSCGTVTFTQVGTDVDTSSSETYGVGSDRCVPLQPDGGNSGPYGISNGSGDIYIAYVEGISKSMENIYIFIYIKIFLQVLCIADHLQGTLL